MSDISELPRCQARQIGNGEPCTQPAMAGSTVCRKHGGKAPQVMAAAARRKERERAEQAVVLFGLPREVDPQIALLEEVWRSSGAVRWLEERIGEMSDELELTQLDTKGRGQVRIPSVWVSLYQSERDRLVRVCKAAIDAGLAERQVKLAEAQGRLLANVIHGILADLGMDDDPRVPEVVRGRLLAVEA